MLEIGRKDAYDCFLCQSTFPISIDVTNQHPWYWLWWIGNGLSYPRKNFNYQRHVNVEEWHRMQNMFMQRVISYLDHLATDRHRVCGCHQVNNPSAPWPESLMLSHNVSFELKIRADSVLAPRQWKTALLCNDVSNWLGSSIESILRMYTTSWDVATWHFSFINTSARQWFVFIQNGQWLELSHCVFPILSNMEIHAHSVSLASVRKKSSPFVPNSIMPPNMLTSKIEFCVKEQVCSRKLDKVLRVRTQLYCRIVWLRQHGIPASSNNDQACVIYGRQYSLFDTYNLNPANSINSMTMSPYRNILVFLSGFVRLMPTACHKCLDAVKAWEMGPGKITKIM